VVFAFSATQVSWIINMPQHLLRHRPQQGRMTRSKCVPSPSCFHTQCVGSPIVRRPTINDHGVLDGWTNECTDGMMNGTGWIGNGWTGVLGRTRLRHTTPLDSFWFCWSLLCSGFLFLITPTLRA
jgi:hypothetical protein